jgi:hypothetical protein
MCPHLEGQHFRRAATTVSRIEPMHQIRKGQFKIGKLRIETKSRLRFGMQCSLPNQRRVPPLIGLDPQCLHYD